MPAKILLTASGAALAAIALAAPAPAAPVKQVTYAVTSAGEGQYAYVSDGSSGSRLQAQAAFAWETTIPEVAFAGDRVLTANAKGSTVAAIEAEGMATLGSDTFSCSTSALAMAPFPGELFGMPYTPGADPVVRVRSLKALTPDFNDCESSLVGYDISGEAVDGRHTFDTDVAVPRDQLGADRIVVPVREEVTGARCPNNRFGGAESCRVTFEGTITFDKTGESIVEESELPPTGPGGGGGGSQAPVVIDADPPALASFDGSAALAKTAKSLKVSVRCVAACDGAVTVNARDSRGKQPLGRKAFTAKAGATVNVTLRFKRRAQRAIRRADGVDVGLRATAPGRDAAEQAISVPLSSPSSKAFTDGTDKTRRVRGARYKGKTSKGSPISFTVRGNKVYDPLGGVGVSCLPIQGGGTPSTGVDLLDAHGAARLGADVNFMYKQKVYGHYNEAEVNHRFTSRRGRNGVITGELRFQYQYLVPKYTPGTFSIYSCVGSATYKARPVG